MPSDESTVVLKEYKLFDIEIIFSQNDLKIKEYQFTR